MKRLVGQLCREYDYTALPMGRRSLCPFCNHEECRAVVECSVPHADVFDDVQKLVTVRIGKDTAYLTRSEAAYLIASLAQTLADFDISDGL